MIVEWMKVLDGSVFSALRMFTSSPGPHSRKPGHLPGSEVSPFLEQSLRETQQIAQGNSDSWGSEALRVLRTTLGSVFIDQISIPDTTRETDAESSLTQNSVFARHNCQVPFLLSLKQFKSGFAANWREKIKNKNSNKASCGPTLQFCSKQIFWVPLKGNFLAEWWHWV